MKKAINKQERKQLLQNLVVHAAKVKGAAVVDNLRQMYRDLADIYRKQHQMLVPELSFPRQKQLLQQLILSRLSYRPYVKTPTKASGVEFGVLHWSPARSRDEALKQTQIALHEAMYGAWGTSGVLVSTLDGWHTCSIKMINTFPDVPTAEYDRLLSDEEQENQVMSVVTHKHLILLHGIIVAELQNLRDLLDEGYETYQELEAALAPVKTPAQLYELMPESMPHWPETLKYAPPTKELADPAAINDIRAKLKKGLPI